MLKQLLPIERELPGQSSEAEGDEDAYGVWHTTNMDDALKESRQLYPVQRQPDIWPNWAEGRPSKFRLTHHWPAFKLGRVWHNPHERTQSLELEWEPSMSLLALQKRPESLLPPNYTHARSGVYRIFRPEADIPRFAGPDPTGTIYIGKAGTGKQNWSILRTRVNEILRMTHQASIYWGYKNPVSLQHPWGSLSIEWAFTGMRLNSRGEEEPTATLAERWLLSSYRSSFGELPPLNDR